MAKEKKRASGNALDLVDHHQNALISGCLLKSAKSNSLRWLVGDFGRLELGHQPNKQVEVWGFL